MNLGNMIYRITGGQASGRAFDTPQENRVENSTIGTALRQWDYNNNMQGLQ